MYNTSDICSPTPPPDKLLIKHSISAGLEKLPNKKQKTRRRKIKRTTQINWMILMIWKKQRLIILIIVTQIQSFLTVSIRFRLQFLIIKLTMTIKFFTIIKKIIFIMIKMIIMIKKSLYEMKEHLEMMLMVLKVNYKGQYFEEEMKD